MTIGCISTRVHSVCCRGENAGKLSSELTEKYPETEWREIRRTRDFIAHNYHKTDLNKTWITIKEEIPALKEVCNRILRELETS